jgi:hypothetical protein
MTVVHIIILYMDNNNAGYTIYVQLNPCILLFSVGKPSWLLAGKEAANVHVGM